MYERVGVGEAGGTGTDLYAGSKVQNAREGRAPEVGVSLRLLFYCCSDPKILPAWPDTALPGITCLHIFLRHWPLPQLSFQCWSQKMPSPAEFFRQRLWHSYLESRLSFNSCVWGSCKDE